MRFLILISLLLFSSNSALAQELQLDCQCTCKPKVNIDAGIADSGVGTDSGFDAGKPDSGSVSDSGMPATDSGAPPTGSVPRPPASKGVGFYVVGSKLYDANGKEFRIRGTNKTHQDFWAQGLSKTKSNTTRWIIYFTSDPDRMIRDLQSPNIGGSTNDRAVQVPGFWDGTCKSDSGSFDTMVNRWVSWASKTQTIERFTILNIANEWGSNETAWKDAYISAIPRIRAAGWHGTIMVDAPGCGQNGMAIARYGAAILAADPERNVIFDWHIYGLVFDSVGGIPRQFAEQIDLVPTLNALRDSGVAVVIGEFGPGRNIGPSPTMLTPQRVMDAAEAYGIGYMSWSWDDNDQSNARCSNNGFCHAFDPNVFNSQSDLTDWGKVMDGYWSRLAQPATIFSAPQTLRLMVAPASTGKQPLIRSGKMGKLKQPKQLH